MKLRYFWTTAAIIALLHTSHVAAATKCDVLLGQRVVLLVDHPSGHPTLWRGMRGTVICLDEWDPALPVLVSWEGWTGGHNATWWCTTHVLQFSSSSCWWMACSDVAAMPRVPDLLDGGVRYRSFSPHMLEAGKADQQFEVSFRLRNGGIGDPSNVVYANIYASQDDRITKSDYYIGNVNCYISGDGSMDMSWQRAFPTSIPAGIYYIGWIIDPDKVVSEYDESNNTACMTCYRLTVWGPTGQPSLAISAASGGKTTNPGEGVFVYPAGEAVPIVASADPNCSFFAWTGSAVEAGKVVDPLAASTSVTVDARYTLTALFHGPHMIVDDFERFSDPCNVIGREWVDGISFSTDKRGHTGNGTGASVGNSPWPSPQNPTVHGGIQSMLFDYENSVPPWYSEVERTWGTQQNWKTAGATSLSIWHRGSANNAAETLYVALKDCHGKVGVSAHPDPLAARGSEWSCWSIPLARFESQGVMLSRIMTMYIGAGNRKEPVRGGHGVLYIDDISLAFEPAP